MPFANGTAGFVRPARVGHDLAHPAPLCAGDPVREGEDFDPAGHRPRVCLYDVVVAWAASHDGTVVTAAGARECPQ